MKEFFRDTFDEAVVKTRARIMTLMPYFENVRRVSISLSLRAVIVTVIVFSALWLGKSAWKWLTNQEVFLVSPATFSFETPDWATDKFIHEIKNIRGLKRKYNIFEKNLVKNIANAYESSPLIAKVHYVERNLPDRLRIKFEVRRPVAIIRGKGREYLVDKDCVRLPGEFYKYPEDGDESIYIISSKSTKVPEHGERWNDKSIGDGVELLNYLKHNKTDKLLRIASIDVSKVNGRGKDGNIDVELWTKDGAKIKWGCPASRGRINELSNKEKLQNLLSVAMEEGADLSKMEYVDVRWKTPLAKRVSIH